MAPVTRRSVQAGSGVNATKIVHRKTRSSRASSQASHAWNNADDDEDDDQNINGYDEPSDGDEPQVSIEGPHGVAQALHPLRELAEKVGNEVESFAVALDKFVGELPVSPGERYEAAQELVLEFKAIAQESVTELRKTHQRERDAQLKEEWSKRANVAAASISLTGAKSLAFGKGSGLGVSLFGRKAESVKALRQWEQEVDVWELFRLILEIHFRPHDEVWQEEKDRELSSLDPPHRYTPESQLWDRFLIEDDIAKERALIKRWLEETADHQQSNLAGIFEELEAKSGAGKGLWAKGWVNTREKIKAEKRLRTWPRASEAIQPQIRRSDNEDLLVTTLDPDAMSRQQRTTEKPDQFFERAFWIACWDMLRRGKPWNEIRQWCEEHGQGWRAVIMNKAGDGSDVLSNAAWRKMCFLASQSGCSNEYEAAVYGLLGGNVKAVQKICSTVDDNIYAYYNGILIRQFDQYLQKVAPNSLTACSGGRALVDESFQDPEQAQQAITDLVIRLRSKPNTQAESVQPLKIIQSYLLANETESLINTLGYAISDLEARTRADNTEGVVIQQMRPLTDVVMPETEIALDSNALRIVSHICIILSSLRGTSLEDDLERNAEENVIVAYMQKLREAGKRDLLILYASQLDRERSIEALGHMLHDVTQESEQIEMLKLMTDSYHLDTTFVLTQHLYWLVSTLGIDEETNYRPLKILEESGERYHPGQRIKPDFLPNEMTQRELELVRGLKWFVLLEGHWDLTFWALSLAMRTCLINGRVACALEIVREHPFIDISRRKSHQTIKRAINIMEDTVPALSEDGKERRHLEWMKRQARTYYELEQLMMVVEAMAQWAFHEDPYVSKLPKPTSVPIGLKQAKTEVDEYMAPLLNGILRNSNQTDELRDFEQIRKMYLPEIVIAYQVFLYTAGSLITRDCFLESMDLSVSVANEKNGLAAALVVAGRMRELVTSFAYSSKAILTLKATNTKPWRAKKDREGRDPSIWDDEQARGQKIHSQRIWIGNRKEWRIIPWLRLHGDPELPVIVEEWYETREKMQNAFGFEWGAVQEQPGFPPTFSIGGFAVMLGLSRQLLAGIIGAVNVRSDFIHAYDANLDW
ncbi:nuclear pore complex protein Nup107 [Acrodontium crateriforme]|uniref:Nuclear pore complex protein n=1 Tax=Acrodontium crateriforme TaxID=150365 RepID=A0AAQ3M2M5_9PEZI|nr:nuclear pore complex protein Nup107 [Acrodontium crateriforme]